MTARAREGKQHQFDKKLLKVVLSVQPRIQLQVFEGVCACVCFQDFGGVDVVTLPAAVMLLAIQVVVRRL